jgi:hypothetical protein
MRVIVCVIIVPFWLHRRLRESCASTI